MRRNLIWPKAMSDFPGRNQAPMSITHVSMLPDVVLDSIFSFIGPGQYRYVAGTCHCFRNVYDNERNNRGKRTFWSAAAASVACAELVLEDYILLDKQESDVNDALYKISMNAVKFASVDVLEWTRQRDFKVHWLGGTAFERIGYYGHINVLEWVDSTPAKWKYDDLLRGAVGAENINVLDWLLRSRGTLMHRHALRDEEHKKLVWDLAGYRGHVSILQWLKDNKLVPTNDENICLHASQNARLNVLDWLVENGHQITQTDIIGAGLRRGHIPVLEWVQDHDGTFSEDHCAEAASYNRLSVLQWLRENNCPWDRRVLQYAELLNYADILEWARANGCPEP